MGILQSIQGYLAEMPPIQKRIGQFVLDNPQEVVRMSISRLAMQTGAKSEASVVKFYRQFGFSGYHDFKVTLATEIAGAAFHTPDGDIEIAIGDDIPTIKKKIFLSSIHILEKNSSVISDAILEKTVEILYEAKRVIIIGYGTSAVACYDLFVKLSRLGVDCHYSLDAHLNALMLADPRQGDVLFCFSYSGESKDVVLQAEHAKGRARIIAMTGEPDSPLARISDVCITVNSLETMFRTDAMVSRMVQITIIDILFTALAMRGGNAALDRLAHSRQGLSFLKF